MGFLASFKGAWKEEMWQTEKRRNAAGAVQTTDGHRRYPVSRAYLIKIIFPVSESRLTPVREEVNSML